MSATLNTTNIKHASSGSNNIVLASNGSVTIPSLTATSLTTNSSFGKVLQVVSSSSNTHQSSTSTSYVDLSGVTASITPASSSNKILIMCSLAIGKANNHSFLGRVVRNGSAISGAGGLAGSGSHIDGVWWNIRSTEYSANSSTVHYLDSPSTSSAVTYKAQGKTTGSSHGFSLNRTVDGGNDLYSTPAFSSITLMEIAA